MKYVLLCMIGLFSAAAYSQISPAIPGGGTIVSATVVSATTTYNGTIKCNNTLTVNYGVDFTINGNVDGGTHALICLGNNKITITGNVNSNVYIDMRGDVCIYVNGVFNTSSGFVTATGANNFITSGSNMNNPGNLPTTICAKGNASNPCSNPATIACANLCDGTNANNVGTYNGSGFKDSGNNNKVMTSTVRAVINANFTATSFSCCSLTVNSGVTLTINSGVVVTVANQIINNGTIIIENGGSLVQVSDNSSTAGNVTAKRITTPLKQYDYTYWSSPVVGATLTTVSSPSIYYEFNPLVGSNGTWVSVGSGTVMQPGSGYIARAPNNLVWANNPTVTATFTGKPNSGKITKTIYKNGTSISNLVGNPYPSALDAKAFLQANQTNITGNLYFWTHYTKISNPSGNNNAQNYTTDDYAVYNLTGSTGTGTGNSSTGSEVVSNRPNGQIASGQAFFLEAKTNNVTIEFNNSMRTGGTNTQFFRSANATQAGVPNESRVWISLSNDEGAYSETLVGYVDGATNGLDNLYDATKLDGGNYVALYSILGTDNLVIQGRALPFSENDIIPLGYNTTIAGSLTLSLNDFDGLFENQQVYILDKKTGISTKISGDGPYNFTTEPGTFNDRFELRFNNATLGVPNPVAANGVVIFRKGNRIEVESDGTEIQSMAVYDLLGRSLYANDTINSPEFATNELNVHGQVVIVKVKMADHSECVKKVILN